MQGFSTKKTSGLSPFLAKNFVPPPQVTQFFFFFGGGGSNYDVVKETLLPPTDTDSKCNWSVK